MAKSKERMLVTHARPHLDDVAAIWLLKKFHPDFGEAGVEFLMRPASGQFAIPSGAVGIGIGRGQFDEHKGDLEDCATSLVWKWLVKQDRVKIDKNTQPALERLVDWVLKEDLGQLNSVPWREWSVSTVFANYDEVVSDDDHQVYAFGVQLLESLLIAFRDQVKLDTDWAKRQEFLTRWGKAVALESEVYGSSWRAYQAGAVLVCEVDRTKGYRQIRAEAHSDVDLSEAYAVAHKQEPKASWFLHHSKRLLLCGSGSATDFVSSKLTLQQLIDLVKLDRPG